MRSSVESENKIENKSTRTGALWTVTATIAFALVTGVVGLHFLSAYRDLAEVGIREPTDFCVAFELDPVSGKVNAIAVLPEDQKDGHAGSLRSTLDTEASKELDADLDVLRSQIDESLRSDDWSEPQQTARSIDDSKAQLCQ